jgi:tetratricopeptide (TPR) repeat protein
MRALLGIALIACVAGLVSCVTTKEPAVNEEQARGYLNTANEFMKATPPQPARANAFFKSAIDSNYRLLAAHTGYQDSFFEYYNADVAAQETQKNEMLAMYAGHVKKYPADAMFQYLYGRMLDKAGMRGEAAPYFKEAVRLDEKYYPAHEALAKYYEEVGKNPLTAREHREKAEKYRAIQEARDAIAADPSNIPAHRQYQDVMLAAEKSHDVEKGAALKEYEQRLAGSAGTAEEARYLYLYGRLLGQSGDLEAARTHFERAAELDPKMPWPCDGLGIYCMLKAGTPGISPGEADDFMTKALGMFEKAVRLDGKQLVIKKKLAGLYLEVSARRQARAEEIRLKAEGRALTPDELNQVKAALRDSYRMESECKARLMEMLGEKIADPEVQFYLAAFMFSDQSHVLAKQAAEAGLALLKEKPLPDAKDGEAIKVKLTGIAQDSAIWIRRLEENRDLETSAYPHSFFDEEFGARMGSEKAAMRANTVLALTAFIVQSAKRMDELDPDVRGDYERMQMSALKMISGAVFDKEDAVRLNAVKAVGGFQVKPMCEEVGKILVNAKESEELRREAALALGDMRLAAGVDFLIEGLKDESQSVREYSADGLRSLGVQTFGYDYAAEAEKRAEAIAKIKQWWDENKANYRAPE